MIPVCRPFWGVEEEQAALRVMRSGRLISGPEVEKFEHMVAQAEQHKFAIATSSGTTALHLALLAVGVKPTDQVIVPAFTFVATANAVLACGAKPVLKDINIRDFNIFPIVPDGDVVVPVLAFGQPLKELSFRNNQKIVIDAACGLGSNNLFWGNAAIYSFHATKIATTGEGGAVVTDNPDVAAKVRVLRDQKHGKQMAYNYRMTEIQGAIGQAQMEKLPLILTSRKIIAERYNDAFAGKIRARIPPKGGNYQSYTLLLDLGESRMRVIEQLASKGVEALPGTQFLGNMPHLSAPGLPNAFQAGLFSLRIPIFPQMSGAEIDTVVKAVKAVLGK